MKLVIKGNGFSFIEVMVAMVILAFGLLGLAGITTVVIRTNSLAQQTNIATDIADSLMRAVKSSVAAVACDNVPALGGCPILSRAGLATSPAFYPHQTNDCGLVDILDTSGTAKNFDIFQYSPSTSFLPGPTGLEFDFPQTENICSMTSNVSYRLLPNRYLRYYRIYGSGTTRTIVVVVMWQDRGGNWRHVKVQTTAAV